MKRKELLLNFLDEIIHQLEELDESDLEKIEKGDFSISLKLVKKKGTATNSSIIPDELLSSINSELEMCKSRDEGYSILDKYLQNKKQLEFFARHYHIFFMKQDKIDDLRKKIVEGIVGARLRSDVIQDKT